MLGGRVFEQSGDCGPLFLWEERLEDVFHSLRDRLGKDGEYIVFARYLQRLTGVVLVLVTVACYVNTDITFGIVHYLFCLGVLFYGVGLLTKLYRSH